MTELHGRQTTLAMKRTASREASASVRVVVVAAAPVARAGFRALLHRRDEIEVVADCAPDAVESAIERARPNVVVVAPSASSESFDDVAHVLRGRDGATGPRVVVVGSDDDPQHIIGTISAGADAYLPVDVGAEQLRYAVREVHAGRHVIPPDLAFGAILATRPRPDDPAPLTPRELEVLSLLSEGQTNAQIAGRLFVAVGTVKAHVEHILFKLGAVSRTDAAVRAAERGLLTRTSADRRRP